MLMTLILIVLAAAVGRYLIGALWYMPKGIFGNAWMREYNIDPATDFGPNSKADGMKSMIIGFVVTFLSTFILGLFIANFGGTYLQAFLTTLLLWAGFMIPMLMQRKIYDPKKTYTWRLFFIDASHELVGHLVAAAIISAFMF